MEVFHTGTSKLSSMAFSPDGELLATVGLRSVDVWDVTTRTRVAALEDRAVIASMSPIVWSPDGRIVAIFGPDGAVHLWDFQSDTVLRMLPGIPGHGGGGLAYSPDGAMLAVASHLDEGNCPGALSLWDVSTGDVVWRWSRGEHISSVAYHPSGQTIAVVIDRQPVLLDPQTAKTVDWLPTRSNRFDVDFKTQAIACSPDGAAVVASTNSGAIVEWELAMRDWMFMRSPTTFTPSVPAWRSTGRPGWMFMMSPTTFTPDSVMYSPDGTLIAGTSRRHRQGVLFDRTTGDKIAEWGPDDLRPASARCGLEEFTCLAFRPGGSVLALGRDDGTVTF